MNIAVFAYNFPHKKTQDFLLQLLIENIKPRLVLAQDWVKLNIPSSTYRVRPKHICLTHPRDICARFGIDYYVINHNEQKCQEILRDNNIEIGIISGARILKKETIGSVSKGIVNFHLGIIPYHRGIDGLQWSIYEGYPLGVTAHIIDERVDAGYIINKSIIKEFLDDTFVDLSIRVHETQLCILADTIRILSASSRDSFEPVTEGKVYRKMPPELEAELPLKLAERLKNLDT